MIVREYQFPSGVPTSTITIRVSRFVQMRDFTDPASRYELVDFDERPRHAVAACTSEMAAAAASRLLNGWCAEDLAASRAEAR